MVNQVALNFHNLCAMLSVLFRLFLVYVYCSLAREAGREISAEICHMNLCLTSLEVVPLQFLRQ